MLKNISKNKKILIIVLIGFFMIMFDQNISLGRINPYPAYKTDSGYNLQFQVYSLNYTYGAGCGVDEEGFYTGDVFYQLTFDVIPDVIGFIILAVFLKKMSKLSRLFGLSSIMAWIAVAMYGFIHLMPFFFNGMTLSYLTFWTAIAMFGIEAVVGYVFVCGVCDTLSGYEHKRSRTAVMISWFSSVVLSAIVCILRWVAAIGPGLLVSYEIIQLAVHLLLYYFVYRDADYIVKEKQLGR